MVSLKAMLATQSKIMQKLGKFFSLSYKTLGPQTVSVHILKNLQLQEAFVHECFRKFSFKSGGNGELEEIQDKSIRHCRE
jgi:hypothetical protein